ncbi:MAG: Asp-tRNA(Asn)/Glu-tRNA(Gln) amidotransferase subunit GatC [Cytophagales bacterium]|nr:Asp-tRNA(Asn)/Glu-tRNA(Gln) amidotransferase subunit GatC [Cytophagales bacterium]
MIKPEDEAQMLADLNRILTWVEKLRELDTTGVEPLTHISPETNVLRDDIVSETLARDEALRNAPRHDDSHFRVPKVIE